MRRANRRRFRAAFACELLDTDTVGDHQPGSAVIDQILFTQALRDTRYARTVHAEDARHMFMCEPEFVAAASTLKRQEPSTESLLDRVKCVANDPLRELFDLGVDVVVNSHLQTRVGSNFTFEQVTRYDQRGAGNTDLHTVRRTARVEGRRDSDSPFTADDPDLDHSPVFKNLKLRYDCGLRKVDIVDSVVLLIQVLVLCKIYAFQKRPQSQQMLRTDILQKDIAGSPRTIVDKDLKAVNAVPDPRVVWCQSRRKFRTAISRSKAYVVSMHIHPIFPF